LRIHIAKSRNLKRTNVYASQGGNPNVCKYSFPLYKKNHYHHQEQQQQGDRTHVRQSLSLCVYSLSQQRLVATLPIHALFTAYVEEDTQLHSKQYIVTAATTLFCTILYISVLHNTSSDIS